MDTLKSTNGDKINGNFSQGAVRDELPRSSGSDSTRQKRNKILIIVGVVSILLLICGILGVVGLSMGVFQSVQNVNNTDDTQKVCSYGESVYQNGESFEALDGCNECVCNNGVVSCTESSCSDNVNEDDTGNANDEDGNTSDSNNGASTSSSTDVDWKTVKFDLELGGYTDSFETEIPSEADVKVVSEVEPNDSALITMDDVVMRVFLSNEDFTQPLKSAVEVFDHSQFGQVYRVMQKGNPKQWYSNDVTLSGTCATIVSPDTPAPCGLASLFESTGSYDHVTITMVSCETDTDAGIVQCDQIVKKMTVTQK